MLMNIENQENQLVHFMEFLLKDEGKALCDSGKLKEGEAKLVEAIKIISHTRMN